MSAQEVAIEDNGRMAQCPIVTTVLEREMYSEAEAARLLRVSQSTLSYWLEGGERRGKTYQPIIRPEPRGGHPPVTWAEFVEAGWLRMYRRTQAVPMAQLRAFIDKLRDDYGVPYPLADRRPLYVGRQLVIDAQDEAGLDPEFRLVAAVEGQHLLLGPAELFVQRVRWEGDAPAAWRPVEDDRSPVLIDPERRFGRPSVHGISTEVIFEHIDGGEDEHYVAEGFGLSLGDVRWAMAYETSFRAA